MNHDDDDDDSMMMTPHMRRDDVPNHPATDYYSLQARALFVNRLLLLADSLD